MLASTRILKQASILIIVSAIIGLGFFGFSRLTSEPVITPTPDPRELLESVQILESSLFKINENDYDVLLKVRNPNESFGSGNVGYTLLLSNSGSTDKTQIVGSFYILPGQTKYVLESPIRLSREFDSMEAKITSIEWQELDALGRKGVDIIVTGDSFQIIKDKNKYAILRGLVNNESDFDLSSVDVVAVIQDDSGKAVATNRTEIRTFLSGTSRGFEVSWFSPIIGSASKSFVEANANIFENGVFVRTYGGKERFQSY